MLRDLFFSMFDIGLTWTSFCLVFFMVGIILLIISLIKLKSTVRIVGIIISIILMWQIIPQIFFHIAYFSQLETPIQDALKTHQYNYKYNDKFIKYMQIAKNTAIIPWQKGVYLCEIAVKYSINYEGKNAIETYDKAYKYVNSYKYNCWKYAFIPYAAGGHIDTAVKIATEQNVYSIAVAFLIQQGNYGSALEMENKAIEKKPDSYFEYARRAFINYKLDNYKEEVVDYNKALALAKNQKEKKYVLEYKQIRKNIINRQKESAKKMGF